MSVEINKAVEYYERLNYVSEKEVPSIMNSIFRGKLEEKLKKKRIEYRSSAVNVEGEGYLYYYVQPSLFNQIEDEVEYFTAHFS